VPLFGEVGAGDQKCRRERIANPSGGDWMESQAGYVCTALLAPKRRMLEAIARMNPSLAPLIAGEPATTAAAQTVAEAFNISLDAAHVRLQVIGAVEPPGQARLF